MIYLRQSTASQSVLIGPFLDDTDGKTAETALTINASDIRLSKNGGNMAAKNSGGGTHDEAGWYTITLDATDTNTVGRLQVSVHVAGALPVWMEFQVLEEAIYDALFAASAAGYSTLDAAGIRTAVGLAAANLDAQLADIPTVAELNARTLAAADYFDPSADTVANVTAVASVSGSVGSVTGNVGGNVVGSVGSISGVTFPTNFGDLAITVTTGRVTVGTNEDKAGYSLTPTTGLGNQTANITGNLSGSVGSVTGAVGSVTGNVGGSVTGSVGSISGVTFPANFGDLAITVTTGRVTVGTNADKSGYSLTPTTGLGNQTADITGSLSGSVGSVTGNVGGNVTGSVGSVLGGINTAAGTIQTLDALDAAQDSQHATTQAQITALNNLSTSDIDATLAAYDAPTKTEMDAAFTEVKGATWSASTDTLEAIRDRGDNSWSASKFWFTDLSVPYITNTYFSDFWSRLADILTDTNALQTDWADGGRLDALLDAKSTLTAEQVNAQVLDVVNVDTLVAGVSVAESLRRIGAITSGTITGAGTGTETFVDYAGSAATIVITVDASGNRSGVAYN